MGHFQFFLDPVGQVMEKKDTTQQRGDWAKCKGHSDVLVGFFSRINLQETKVAMKIILFQQDIHLYCNSQNL